MKQAPPGPISIASPMDRKRVGNYTIIESTNVIKMEEMIVDKLKSGYVLYGFPFTMGQLYCQGMIRYFKQDFKKAGFSAEKAGDTKVFVKKSKLGDK